VSEISKLINREMRRRRERIRGKTAGDPAILHIDEAGLQYKTWVSPEVDIGQNRTLKNVPIRANGKDRYYARALQPVWLDRDARGRWEITAPADRVIQGRNRTLWNRGTDVETPVSVGFDVAYADFLDYWQEQFAGKSRWELDADGGRNDDFLALVVTPRG